MKTANLSKAERHTARLLGAVVMILMALRQAEAQTAKEETNAGSAPVQHRRKVVVSIPHRKLALIEDGQVKKVYPVAVGATVSPSPTGAFEVKTRLVKPTYYHTGKVIAPGPANPLGTRWIGLSAKGYGIHGTNVERSVGKAASHGCIRMHRADLEELFAMLQVGDAVEIRGESDEEVAAIFGDASATDSTPSTSTSISASAAATTVADGQ